MYSVLKKIQKKAQSAGLWNLFLPGESGLSQLDYAPLAELTGRCSFAPEVFNCSAPGLFKFKFQSSVMCFNITIFSFIILKRMLYLTLEPLSLV